MVEFFSQSGEVADLSINIRTVDAGNSVHGFARSRLIIGEGQQLADGFKCETQIARAPNERQPRKMLAAVGTIVGPRPRWRRKKTDLLVISHGLDLGCRSRSKLSDFHA